MKSKPFTLTKYQKRGTTYWRVRGHLHGQRLEKSFSELGRAKAWRDAKEIERTNASRATTATLTRLDQTEAFDAEKALAMLDGKGTLCDAASAFLASYVSPDTAISMGSAAKLYDDDRGKFVLRGLLSKPQHKCTRAKVERFVNWIGPDLAFATITKKRFQDFLDGTFTSPKNYENIRGALSHFVKWGVGEGYLNADPTIGVTSLGRQISKARGVAKTKSPAEIREMFTWLEANAPEIIPAYALMTFAGIRPCQKSGEIIKLRPAQVNLNLGVITVLPEVSKVKEKRKFKMTPNLKAWLRAYPVTDETPLVCHNWGRLRNSIGDRFKLSHDVMRHSAITYWVAKNKSIYDAADQFGNSEAIIRKHYKDADRTEAEAEEFFEIFPRESCGKMVKFAG